MKKNKKLKLDELSVTSFITTLSEKEMAQAEGGDITGFRSTCCSMYNCPTAGICSTSDIYGTICYTLGGCA